MSIMPLVSQYSSVTPDLHSDYDPLGDLSPVNFSGAPGPDGSPAQWTMGGWVRLKPQPTKSYQVCTPYGKGGVVIFAINYLQTGELVAGFAGQPQVRSTITLADNVWHFIAVSYFGNALGQTGQDRLRLYVDGSLLDDAVGNGPNTPAAGYNKAALGDVNWRDTTLDFATWAVWSVAETDESIDAPSWDEDFDGDNMAGLVRAVRFSIGAVYTLNAGGGWVMAPAPRDWGFNWNTPCLQLVKDWPAPSGPSNPLTAWTVMGWLQVQSARGGMAYCFSHPATGTTSCGFAYDSAKNQLSPYACAHYFSSPPPQALTIGSPIPGAGNAWHFFAFVRNGSKFTMYCDGQVQFQDGLIFPAELTPDLFVGPNNNLLDMLYVQNVSIWNSALYGNDLLMKAQLATYAFEPGCIGWFAFDADMGDSVSGASLVYGANGATVGEIKSPVVDAPISDETRRRFARPAAAIDPAAQVMRYKDYVALARQHGIDPSAEPNSNMKRDPEFVQSVTWFDGMLAGANLTGPLADRLKDRFARNLAAGIQLDQVAPGAGRVTLGERDGVPTVFYGSPSGLVPIGALPAELVRTDGIDMAPYIAVFLDIVGLVVAVIGVVVAIGAYERIVAQFRNRIVEICTRIKDAWNASLPGVDNAIVSFRGIATFFMATKTVSAFFKSVFLGGGFWWTLLQVGLAIVQLIALAVTGAALLLIRIALMVVAVGTLVKDVLALVNSGGSPLELAAGAAPAENLLPLGSRTLPETAG